MKRIVIAAEIKNQAEMNDLVFRLYHHFNFINEIEFCILKSKYYKKGDFIVPSIFGKTIDLKKFEFFCNKLLYRTIRSDIDIEDVCNNTKVVLIYSEPYYRSKHLFFKKNNPKFYWCDPATVRQEGSNFIQAALDCITPKEKADNEKESLTKFLIFSKRLKGRYKESVVIATGPSVENYKKYPMRDKLTLFCNSTILNKDLVYHAKPKILVFADPIFHFGISKYAHSFRSSAKKFLDDYPKTYLIIPIKYYALLKSLFPNNKNQIIGIPFTKHKAINTDINEHNFYTYTTANILTLLLLPLATTFTKKVNLIGCDGRSLDDDDYFWGHGKSVQINNEMDNIQECHPGFFKIDYNEYYFIHCHMLENFISAAEIKNKQFSHLGNTHIPALVKYSIDNSLYPKLDSNRFPINTHHFLIEPDGENETDGHYHQWHIDLAKSLKKLTTNSVTILARKEANYNKKVIVENLFTNRSWILQRSEKAKELVFPYNNNIKDFLDILGKYIKQYQDNKPLHFFMYYGSVQAVKVFLELQNKFKNKQLYFTVCLFSESVNIDPNNLRKNFHPHAGKILTEAVAKSMQFRILSVTQKMSDIVYQLFEVKTATMIHPLINSPSAKKIIKSFYKKAINKPKNKIILYIPCRFGHGKSNENLFEQLKQLLLNTENILLRLRKAEESVNFLKDIGNHKIKEKIIIMPDLETSEFYFNALCEADIIFIPYTKEAFYARTSGILYDTILAQKPVIVMNNTWLSDTTFQFKAGLHIINATNISLQKAIESIINNDVFFSQNINKSSKKLFNQSTFKTLSNQIISYNVNPFRKIIK